MKDFLKKYWQIILIEFLVILTFICFYGRFGDVIFDSFREAYIPQRILEGKILYKDIFVIYPPLAYLINAFLFLICGCKLKVLYFAGLFSTMGIFYLTYNIAKRFCNPFGICLFLISGFALSSNVFTPFFPYSYGILYGLLFTLVSIDFALNKKFPLAYLFYSLAILSKYEFIFLLPALIYLSGKTDWKKNILAVFLPLFVTGVILFLQGVRLGDLKTAFDLINIMSGTKTLYWFYSVMGLTFRLELIPIYLYNIIRFIIPFNWATYQEIILWAFPVIFLVGIFRFKFFDKNEKFLLLASLLVSIKVFFALTLQSYGVFFLPFALISLFILIPKKFQKVLTCLLLFWALIIGFNNAAFLKNKNMELDPIVNYLKENSKVEDRVVIYPECLGINILAKRKSDDKFYSLIPLYVETFGEEIIIKRLEITKPEYIIINNYDTSAYYYRQFGIDYAQDIMKWIKENYKLETTIEDGWTFKIFTH